MPLFHKPGLSFLVQQYLTDSQKTQARGNLDAPWGGDDSEGNRFLVHSPYQTEAYADFEFRSQNSEDVARMAGDAVSGWVMQSQSEFRQSSAGLAPYLHQRIIYNVETDVNVMWEAMYDWGYALNHYSSDNSRYYQFLVSDDDSCIRTLVATNDQYNEHTHLSNRSELVQYSYDETGAQVVDINYGVNYDGRAVPTFDVALNWEMDGTEILSRLRYDYDNYEWVMSQQHTNVYKTQSLLAPDRLYRSIENIDGGLVQFFEQSNLYYWWLQSEGPDRLASLYVSHDDNVIDMYVEDTYLSAETTTGSSGFWINVIGDFPGSFQTGHTKLQYDEDFESIVLETTVQVGPYPWQPDDLSSTSTQSVTSFEFSTKEYNWEGYSAMNPGGFSHRGHIDGNILTQAEAYLGDNNHGIMYFYSNYLDDPDAGLYGVSAGIAIDKAPSYNQLGARLFAFGFDGNTSPYQNYIETFNDNGSVRLRAGYDDVFAQVDWSTSGILTSVDASGEYYFHEQTAVDMQTRYIYDRYNDVFALREQFLDYNWTIDSYSSDGQVAYLQLNPGYSYAEAYYRGNVASQALWISIGDDDYDHPAYELQMNLNYADTNNFYNNFKYDWSSIGWLMEAYNTQDDSRSAFNAAWTTISSRCWPNYNVDPGTYCEHIVTQSSIESNTASSDGNGVYSYQNASGIFWELDIPETGEYQDVTFDSSGFTPSAMRYLPHVFRYSEVLDVFSAGWNQHSIEVYADVDDAIVVLPEIVPDHFGGELQILILDTSGGACIIAPAMGQYINGYPYTINNVTNTLIKLRACSNGNWLALTLYPD